MVRTDGHVLDQVRSALHVAVAPPVGLGLPALHGDAAQRRPDPRRVGAGAVKALGEILDQGLDIRRHHAHHQRRGRHRQVQHRAVHVAPHGEHHRHHRQGDQPQARARSVDGHEHAQDAGSAQQRAALVHGDQHKARHHQPHGRCPRRKQTPARQAGLRIQSVQLHREILGSGTAHDAQRGDIQMPWQPYRPGHGEQRQQAQDLHPQHAHGARQHFDADLAAADQDEDRHQGPALGPADGRLDGRAQAQSIVGVRHHHGHQHHQHAHHPGPHHRRHRAQTIAPRQHQQQGPAQHRAEHIQATDQVVTERPGDAMHQHLLFRTLGPHIHHTIGRHRAHRLALSQASDSATISISDAPTAPSATNSGLGEAGERGRLGLTRVCTSG